MDNADGTQDIMEFLYDHAGQPYAFVLDNVLYYYVVNLQGDVVRLVDTSGRTVVSYVYNAWGKHISATPNTAVTNAANVANKNPLRYRGYVYDTETTLYYLQSRYYDPNMGRFLNADAYTSTGQGMLGYNMFAYCNNNPVRYADYTGELLIEITLSPLGYVVAIAICGIGIVYCGAMLLSTIFDWISRQWYYSSVRITYATEEPKPTDETLPRQGLVEGDSDAPPVDAGKQGKHVKGHNNYIEDKSSWPEGQTGVQQTQEAWQNGVQDPRKPDQNVRIGIASDGTIVRVHMGGNNAIHGYPFYPYFVYIN